MDLEMQKYEDFVKKHPKGHFAQSLKWAKLKKEWKHEIVTVEDENGNIKGSMLLLIRKIPIFKNTIIYSPRGPVCDIHDEDTFTKLIKKADSFKIINIFSSSEKLNYEIIKNIFDTRVINLEDLFIKIIQEKDKLYVQLYDENIFENKIEINTEDMINIKKIDMKLNKKIKLFI